MVTRDQTRDGTAVTERSEVVTKTRIVCGEIIERKGIFLPFHPASVHLKHIAANGLTPFTTA
jgi:hypothetical protein